MVGLFALLTQRRAGRGFEERADGGKTADLGTVLVSGIDELLSG
ncbi:hypothetical protein UF75_5139 [Desulfosporosinus sp. I2]|nr:hypothetical protein [Desulfosporosinus sp. I2]KJR44476.1 hypothetical protein UF75_5139 [Desulfosporosinus sp. I2]